MFSPPPPREWPAVLVAASAIFIAGLTGPGLAQDAPQDAAAPEVAQTSGAEAPEEDDAARQSMRDFVIDSGTFKRLPSPRSMVEFYRNYETLGTWTYDLVEEYIYRANRPGDDKEHWWSRTRRGIQLVGAPLIDLDPSGYVTTTGWETVHEYAHRTRGALGGIDGGFNPEFHDFGDNPYSFSFHLFRTGNATGGAVWRNARPKTLYARPSFLSRDQNLLISAAAGINQQTNLARDHVKREALEGDTLDVSNFYSYTVNAASYFFYNDDLLGFIFSGSEDAVKTDPWGDRAVMIKRWRTLGRHYSDTELSQHNLLATALSGSTISYAMGAYDYIMEGERETELIRFGGFRLPDYYTYYNTNGPTLMVSSDYRLADDKLISFAVETVTDGKDSTDFALGYDQSFDTPFGYDRKLDAGAEVIYNDTSSKTGLGLNAKMNIYRNVSLSGGYHYYNFDTLRGQRDIPSLKDGKDYQEFYAGLLMTF